MLTCAGLGKAEQGGGMRLLSAVPFRKKRTPKPFAPAACSHRLALRPRAFLNQLFHFDQPRLVIRGNGLALCRETEFGVFFLSGDRYVDQVSGLEIVLDQVTGLFLHHDEHSPPSFEIRFREEGFACAIYPSGTPRSRETLDSIVKSFATEQADPAELRAAGAARWLDECLALPASDSSEVREPFLKATEKPDEFQLELQTEGYSFAGPFQPGNVDTDDGVLRISDCRHKTVVYSSAKLGANHLPPKLARIVG